MLSLRLLQLNTWELAFKESFMYLLSAVKKVEKISMVLNKTNFFLFKKEKIAREENEQNETIELEDFIIELFDENNGKFKNFPKEDENLLTEALRELFTSFPPDSQANLIEKVRNLLTQQKDFEKCLSLFLKTVFF